MKEKISTKNKHRPLHIYDWRFYFISTRTFEEVKYFNSNERKQIFVDKFSKLIKQLNLKVHSWILLENHYHLILEIPIENKINDRFILSEFFRKLHSETASVLNQADNTKRRKVWYQYWDHSVRNEKDFWVHFNYILQNPLKHKLVNTLEESFLYKFSSNYIWRDRLGVEGLYEGFVRYPIRSFVPDGVE